MKTKILFCVNHYAPLLGGCEIVTQHIAEFLSQFYDVLVMTRRVPGIVRNKNHNSVEILEYIPNNIIGFEKQIKSINPDIIFIYSDVFDFFRQVIDVRGRWKIVLAPCGANFLYDHRSVLQKVYSNSSIASIICHSKIDRDYKLFNTDYTREKLNIIPNGIDIKEFDENDISRDEIVKKLNINNKFSDLRWVLNVSNFFPGKGQVYMSRILSELDPAKFAYIQVCSKMSFPIGEQLENEWTKKMKLSNINTVLLKDIDRKFVVSLFKNSNVFVFPSEKEVAPLVLLECMAARLPWVSMDVGNASELQGGKCISAAKNAKYQSIFDGRVCQLFRDSIKNVWESPSIADSGRIQIEKDMNWQVVLPKYKSVIEKCCA